MINIKTLKIRYCDIILFVAFFVNLAVPYFKEYEVTYFLNSAIKAILLLYTGLKVILMSEHKICTMSKLLMLYGAVVAFITLIYGESSWVLYLITIFSLVFLVEYARIYFFNFIDIMMICYEIIVYFNLLSMIIYPDGMFGNRYTFVLGIDNEHIRWLLPAQVVACLYVRKYELSMRPILLTSAIIISILIRQSATTMVSFMFFFFMLLIPFVRNTNVVKISLIGYGVTFFSMIIIQNFTRLSIVQNIIINHLHKDLTFTNRFLVWNNTVEAISRKWIIGYGILSTDNYYRKIGDSYTHNLLLQTMFTGGILLLIIFMLMWQNIDNANKRADIITRRIINAFAVAFLVSGMTEYHFYAQIMIIFIILTNTNLWYSSKKKAYGCYTKY